MMEDRIEDEEGDVLTSLNNDTLRLSLSYNSSPSQPHRKAQSHGHETNKRANFIKHSTNKNIIDPFYDSSDDDDFFPSSTSTSAPSSRPSNELQEYLSQFLDPKPTHTLPSPPSPLLSPVPGRALQEFVAAGGNKGIFRVPLRGAVHPSRPPCLELRPHPLRETQVGWFLRTLVCTDTQIWAGQECGVRFWNFADLYGPGIGPGGRMRRGDEDAAPFEESGPTAPTLCLVVDLGNRMVWSGHKDGRIKSWKMDQFYDGTPFKEAFTWHAYRGPVLSMVMSSYGDLWSGSENGVIKLWPWENIEKSLTIEERHMAALLMERSYIDLKSQVTINGVCNIPSSDVKFMLSDRSRGKVWCAGHLSFSLWDARTRELLKVFNIDGQVDNRVDMSSAMDSTALEDEVKVKFVSSSKKEKFQGSFSFLQRSRNALMGAADAVRRVAAKGAFGDDHRRTEALILTADGMIWTGCSIGSVVQWDGNGKRLQEFHHHNYAVQSFCTYGTRIWVGYISGIVQVLDLNGKLLGGWLAHSSPIIKMSVGAGYVFSLASHGGIRGWSITSPGPIDNILRTEWTSRASLFARKENVKILTGTWNVGQERASQDSLISWLGSVASEVGIIAIGLQEVEMGAGFLAVSAAKETVGLEGSSVGQWWLDTIGKTLDEGTTFERIGSRQLAGLLISIWVRKDLKPHVGDVDPAAVPCGFGRAIGNKGGVGLKLRIHDRVFCFVNCHLAAHLEAVNRRNADFDHIYRTMSFSRQNQLNTASAGVSSAVQMMRGPNAPGGHSEDGKPELSEADMVVFFGDFNYRLHGISYDEARDIVSQRCFDWLWERDQLRAEMKAGKVFQGMREGHIAFPPTYKFERHTPGLAGYDSGEKKRIPAWCDRILYRDNRSPSVSECCLECPVVSSILMYDACMDVTDSDHKPVRCIFSVDIIRIDESIKRQEFGDIVGSNEKIRYLLQDICYVPETMVSTNNIILQNQATSILRITNKCVKDNVTYEIFCEGESTVGDDGQAADHHPRGSFGLPHWLEVTPAAGIIRPGGIAEVSVHHEEFHTVEEFVDGIPQNWWCEDARDKEVILVVNVRGCRSMDAITYRVRVRHCFASRSSRMESTSKTSESAHANVLQRSDIHNFNVSSDVADDLRSLHTP